MIVSGKKKIEIVLIILIFLTPLIFTSSLTSYHIPKIALIEILAFLAFFIWLITKQFHTINSPLNLPILTFLAWGIVSALWATNKFETLEAAFFHIALITIYFMALNNIRNIEAFLIAMVSAGSIVSIYGILQYLGIDFLTPKPGQLISTLGNVNFAGEYLMMIIPLGTVMIFHSKGKYLKITLGIAITLMLTYLLLTKSRGAWVGLAGGGIVLFLVNPVMKGRLKFFLYLILIIIIALSVIYVFSKGREISTLRQEVTSILDMRQSGILFRFLVWKNTLRMVAENPFKGIGLGNFKILYPLYKSPREWHLSGVNVRIERAHNDYLQIASELGLIGLGIFVWLLFSAFKIFKEVFQTKSVLVTGFVASVVSMSITALFGFPLHTPSTSLTFWMILGMVGALRAHDQHRYVAVGVRPKTGTLWLGAVTLIGLATIHVAQVVASDIYLQKARISQKKRDWDRTISECEKSVSFYYPNIQARVYLARALQKKNLVDEAFVELKTILRLHPNDPWVHMCLGNNYLRLKKPDEAISSLEKAARLNPAYLNNLGIAYLKKNMFDEALSAFEKAIAMKWDNELTYTYIGIIHEKKGEDKDER